ncbi:MAG: hypothetical protein HZA52_14610 [Planctomycetes bacterium]|nr:hypothetical protein [Planctomycetota bacterium]
MRVEPWPGDDAAFAWIRVDGHSLPPWITDDPTPGTFHTFAGHVEVEISGRNGARQPQSFEFDVAPGETRVVTIEE